MAKSIWFGNRLKQAWIPAPNVDQDWSDVGRSQLIALDNGGVFVDESAATHKEGTWEWTDSAEALRLVREFRQGVHGPGPFYWVDPYAQDTNLLSTPWATPGVLASGDWKDISDGARGAATTRPENVLGVPTRGFTYWPTNLATEPMPKRRFTILIPPGRKLAFGSFGDATGSAVIALRATRADGTAILVTFTPLAPDGLQSWHAVDLFPYTSGFRVVDIYLARTTLATAKIELDGMRAILVPESTTLGLMGDPFVSGEGANGLSFQGGIRETRAYIGMGRADRRKGFSVRLVEEYP